MRNSIGKIANPIDQLSLKCFKNNLIPLLRIYAIPSIVALYVKHRVYGCFA